MGEETTVVSGIANEMFGTIESFEDVEKTKVRSVSDERNCLG